MLVECLWSAREYELDVPVVCRSLPLMLAFSALRPECEQVLKLLPTMARNEEPGWFRAEGDSLRSLRQRPYVMMPDEKPLRVRGFLVPLPTGKSKSMVLCRRAVRSATLLRFLTAVVIIV